MLDHVEVPVLARLLCRRKSATDLVVLVLEVLGCYRSCIARILVDSTRFARGGWVTDFVHDCLFPTQAMNLRMLSKCNRILRTSTGLSACINVTRGAAAQWCSRRRLISAGIGGSRALGVPSRAVSRPFARPTRSSQARCARQAGPSISRGTRNGYGMERANASEGQTRGEEVRRHRATASDLAVGRCLAAV